MNPLNPVEVRVLGSLVEKDITTPDYYPLTLNALTNACNQSSNRDPVVSFLERDVVRGLDSLREKKLAFMFQGADSRAAKYGHRFPETFGLTRPEVAILCVLMLRGAQTAGEIRGRTGRMHEFASREDAGAPGRQASPPGRVQGAALRASAVGRRAAPGPGAFAGPRTRWHGRAP